jgi:hypothetical protein
MIDARIYVCTEPYHYVWKAVWKVVSEVALESISPHVHDYTATHISSSISEDAMNGYVRKIIKELNDE